MSDIDLTDLLERIIGCINNAEYDDEQDTLTDAFAVIEAQAAEIERLREALHTPLAFIEALHENDPDDQIADNGMTVLDGLKQQAPSVIKTIRAALGETK
jgi:hypothetical protein